MAEFHCVGDDLTLGVSIYKFEAPVGIYGGANVESILSTIVPRLSGGWFGVDENPTSNWAKWRLVEIKWPLKVFPCTDPRVERGLA